jgi:large conductance mechanosensitive channel
MRSRKEPVVIKGFKNFLLQGNVVVIAIGLIVALAFSMLIAAFTSNIIDPIISRVGGKNTIGLGIQLGQPGNPATFMNFGAFISAIIYFIIFIAVVYFFIVVPYKAVQARRGVTVFGDPPPVKTCPACLSDDLPVAASKCKYCGTEQPVQS